MFGRIFLCLRFAWLHCLCFLDLLVSAVRAYIYVGGDAYIAPLWFMVVRTGRCGHRPLQ